MKPSHAAALVVVGWTLWLHYSPYPEDHEE